MHEDIAAVRVRQEAEAALRVKELDGAGQPRSGRPRGERERSGSSAVGARSDVSWVGRLDVSARWPARTSRRSRRRPTGTAALPAASNGDVSSSGKPSSRCRSPHLALAARSGRDRRPFRCSQPGRCGPSGGRSPRRRPAGRSARHRERHRRGFLGPRRRWPPARGSCPPQRRRGPGPLLLRPVAVDRAPTALRPLPAGGRPGRRTAWSGRTRRPDRAARSVGR